jgi:NAD(P)-dependent dehydrogenase (short-subunit alcohol dehydrogenase family)
MIRPGDVALVTGAGRGIGRATALTLADAGCRVVVASRTAADLDTLVTEIRARGGTASAVVADVSREEDASAMVARALDEYHAVDILVNNAGVGTVAPSEVADYDTAEWDRIVGVNLRGAFLCAKHVLPHMRARRRGAVISVGSISGRRGAPNVSPYTVSKFGLAGLHEALLAENHRHGIRVMMVSPGPTDSTIWDAKRTPLTPEVRAAMMRPERVAHVVRFLAELPEGMRIDEIVVLPEQFPVKLWDYRVE